MILTKKTLVGSVNIYEVDEDPRTIPHAIEKGHYVVFTDGNGSIPVMFQKMSDGDNTDVMQVNLVNP